MWQIYLIKEIDYIHKIVKEEGDKTFRKVCVFKKII